MDRKRLNRWLWGEISIRRMFLSFLFIYVVILAYAWFISDRLLFQPHPPSYPNDATILKLDTGRGYTISALHLPAANAKFTLLFCHGNAEDIGDLREYLELYRARGWSVFAFDYSGYGTSGGHPSEGQVYRDVLLAYRCLTRQLQVPPERIVVLGRSLGGGAAVDLAAHEPVGGLVLESAFVSAFRVITRIPLFPVDKFRNLAKLPRVTCPILVIHGRRDRTIPFSHGQALFAAAREPKRNLWVDTAYHDDVLESAGEAYWQALADWGNLIVPGARVPPVAAPREP